jgi:hypothetical protein
MCPNIKGENFSCGPCFSGQRNSLATRRQVRYDDTMKSKPITVAEAGRKGARATLKKYGRQKMREWGKLGGRPPKSKPR